MGVAGGVGVGKTTLMMLLLTELKPSEGKAWLNIPAKYADGASINGGEASINGGQASINGGEAAGSAVALVGQVRREPTLAPNRH